MRKFNPVVATCAPDPAVPEIRFWLEIDSDGDVLLNAELPGTNDLVLLGWIKIDTGEFCTQYLSSEARKFFPVNEHGEWRTA